MLRWPLRHNEIRRNSTSHTFGMVRNGGTRAHQGWDLRALPWTSCFAVADGEVVFADYFGNFGKLVVMEFTYRSRKWFAAYAHLSAYFVLREQKVSAGQWIAETGNTGNASTMTGEDQHLHFEIRTQASPGKGLEDRVDPTQVYGVCPLKSPIFESRLSISGPRATGQGIKVAGVNVL